MKVKNIRRTITMTREFDLDILGATLLTINEAEKLPVRLRRYDRWWWLKSRSVSLGIEGINFNAYTAYAAYVDGDDATIDAIGDKVSYEDGKVRPAIIISNLSALNLQFGDIFEFGDKEFEIISDNKAFCLSDIGQCAFRNDAEALDANIYEKSDIKKYVDEWFEKSIKGESK